VLYFKNNAALIIGALWWFLSFDYQDARCAFYATKLQSQIASFTAAPSEIPPFGLWENTALKDFRLSTELLIFYKNIGAHERAVSLAEILLPQVPHQPWGAQKDFWAQTLWLTEEPCLQQRGLAWLKKSEPHNPAWLLHQFMLWQQERAEPLTEEEQRSLAQHLSLIGEDEMAQKIMSSH
jgi:hypothetical protein